MKNDNSQVIGRILFLLVVVSGCGKSDYMLDVEGPVSIDGDKVSMILEAKTYPARLPDSPVKVTNIRGYLLTAEIGNGVDVDASRRIYGPLYHLPGPTSAVGHDAGVSYPGDDKEHESVLSLGFNHEWIKSEPAKNGAKWQRSILKLDGNQAHWTDGGAADTLPRLVMQHETTESNSGRYVINGDPNGQITIFDSKLGKPIKDEWLEKAYANFRTHKELQTSGRYLTDDLQYLVVFPRFWVNAFHVAGLPEKVTDFTVNGEKYSCDDHGLIYERPMLEPKVFSGLREKKDGDLFPFDPFSLHGQLLFLKYSESEASLMNSDQVAQFSVQFPEPYPWLGSWRNATTVVQVIDASDSRIVFCARPGGSVVDEKVEASVHVLVWHYKENRTEEFPIRVRDLFELKQGYVPKKALPVEN